MKASESQKLKEGKKKHSCVIFEERKAYDTFNFREGDQKDFRLIKSGIVTHVLKDDKWITSISEQSGQENVSENNKHLETANGGPLGVSFSCELLHFGQQLVLYLPDLIDILA